MPRTRAITPPPSGPMWRAESAVIGVSFAHTLLTDNIVHPDSEIHGSQFTIGSGLHIAWRESRCFPV